MGPCCFFVDMGGTIHSVSNLPGKRDDEPVPQVAAESLCRKGGIER